MGSDDIAKKRIRANKARRKQSKEARKTNVRNVLPNILIVTEGETETIYFRHLRKSFALNTVQVQQSSFTDAENIINSAISLAQKRTDNSNYDYIFCVFDLDTVNNKKFIQKLFSYRNTKTRIIPIYSFPCIEVWFLLHFELNSKPYHSTPNKTVGQQVKDTLRKKFCSSYKENDLPCLTTFIDLYDNALENAAKLSISQMDSGTINPITTVHELFNLLKNIKERNNVYEFDETLTNYIHTIL